MKTIALFLAAFLAFPTLALAEYRFTTDGYVVESEYDFAVTIEGSDERLKLDSKFFESLLGAMIGTPSVVAIVELPEVGQLTYGKDNVVVLDTFKLSPFKHLYVVPEENKPATFTFIVTDKDGQSSPLCRVTVTPPRSAGAPTAFDLVAETATGLSVSGMFSGYDPDSEGLAFEVVSAPSKGDLTLSGSQFVYTPHEGKSGADEFSYVARDSSGNYSDITSVSVRINDLYEDLHYVDMAESNNHYAALCLADEGIMRGTTVAGYDFFSPTDTVSRGEFLAMLMQVTGLDANIPTIGATGLAEDADIPVWMKSYISTALASGIVSGYAEEDIVTFNALSPITKAQAAVMTASVLELDAPVMSAQYLDAPEWAAASLAAVSSAGIFESGSLYDETLTRDEAAGILFSIMQGR